MLYPHYIPKAEVARRVGIGRTTLYKYLNQ
ncbi:helix-turn-helix domain-containing protein [uncultured Corynebacterium sp.]|nr:helix-turn-helix domain-containing protein [uncultured Corynebacterium sp.]